MGLSKKRDVNTSQSWLMIFHIQVHIKLSGYRLQNCWILCPIPITILEPTNPVHSSSNNGYSVEEVSNPLTFL